MQNTQKAPKKGIQFLLMAFGGILEVLLLAAAVLFTVPLTKGVDGRRLWQRPACFGDL